MLKMRVFENWRTFETIDSYQTDVQCSICLEKSEAYLELANADGSPFLRICRTCLSEGDQLICDVHREHIMNAER